jgi:hypothetical protein
VSATPDSTLLRPRLVSLSSDGRFVVIRRPEGLRVVDGVARELLHEIETHALAGFALFQQQLFVAADGRIQAFALPSLNPRTVDLPSAAPGFFVASPAGRAIVFASATTLLLEDDGATLAVRELVLPQGAEVTAVVDGGHVWVRADNDLLLVDGNGTTLATVRFTPAERLLGATVLATRPALAVLLRQEDHDVLLTLDGAGERLARASLSPVQLLRVADKRMLAVLITGPRSLSAIDLRYCRSVAATETVSDVADLACAGDAGSFVVAGTPTAAGEFQVRQLSYRELFQPSWPGGDELLRAERPRVVEPPARKRAPPKLESVPVVAVAPTPLPLREGDEAAIASEAELPRLLTYARRLLAGEKQPRRLSHTGLDELMARYGLTELEGALAVVAAAPHLDPALRDDIARLRGEGDHVDGALALKLTTSSAHEVAERLDRLADTAPLIKNGLLRLAPPVLSHAASLAELELLPTPRLLGALRGSDELDPMLACLAALLDCKREDAVGLLPADELERVTQLLGAALTSGMHALVVAAPDAGARPLLRGVAARLGYASLLATDLALLPSDMLPLYEVLTELCHEATHRQAPLVVENLSAWHKDELQLDRLRALLQRLPLPVWATSDRELRPLAAVLPLRLGLAAPDEATRGEGWREATHKRIALTQQELDELGKLPLWGAQISDAVNLAAALASNAAQPATIAHLGRAIDALFTLDGPGGK